MRWRGWIGYLLLVLAVFGCQVDSIPRVVQAGTTFILPFDVGAGELGFGAIPETQSSEALLGNDLQRGNVRFSLCTSAACTSEFPLITRHLSRVAVDPASPAAITGMSTIIGPNGPEITEGQFTGQPLAVLDVPVTTPAGFYQIRYSRSGGFTSPVSSLIGSIQVTAGSVAQFSTISREKVHGYSVAPVLRDSVPYPSIVFSLVNRVPQALRPAAGTLIVSHPPGVTPQGAFENGTSGHGSIVRMVPGDQPNTTMIMFADPDRRTYGLALAFTVSGAPVPQSAFAITSQTLYGVDGAPLPVAQTAGDPGNRFVILTFTDSFSFR